MDSERQFGTSKDQLDPLFDVLGVPRMKAEPRSGQCVACGRTLVPPPEGKDRDHSVCDDCFPDDMRDEWEGRSVDTAIIDLTTGEVREG